MLLLDTNVVSELARPHPDPGVAAWTRQRPAGSLFFSAVGEAELRHGVAIMPPGRRRTALANALERMMALYFAGRILPFDSAVARADNQIAAIARSRGMAVATRNIGDFAAAGVDLVDPWTVA